MIFYRPLKEFAKLYKISIYEAQACLILNGVKLINANRLSPVSTYILYTVFYQPELFPNSIYKDREAIVLLADKLEKENKFKYKYRSHEQNDGGGFESDVNSQLGANAFVTNATANSLCFFAMAYLNNKLKPEEIRELRTKITPGALSEGRFTIEELRSSFELQSVFFLNMYKLLIDEDRFEEFTNNLDKQNRLKTIFKHYKSAADVIGRYNRRVYHSRSDCVAMLSDFEEDGLFFENTGVFAEKIKNTYVLSIAYLNELKMTPCKSCFSK